MRVSRQTSGGGRELSLSSQCSSNKHFRNTLSDSTHKKKVNSWLWWANAAHGQMGLRIWLKIRQKYLIFRAASSGNRVQQELGNDCLPLKCRVARSPKGRNAVAACVSRGLYLVTPEILVSPVGEWNQASTSRLLLGNQQIFTIQPLADSLGLHLLKITMSECREKG